MKKFYEIVIAKENIFTNNKLYMKKGKKEFIRDFTPNEKTTLLQDIKEYNKIINEIEKLIVEKF